LLWISSTDQSARAAKSSAVVGVWASLVPLVLATLLFGEVAGEFDCERAAMEVPVASLLLTVGAVSLFVSLGRLLRRVFDADADRFAQLVSWVAIVVGAVSVHQGNSTMMTLLEGARWDRSVTALVQGVALMLGIIIAMLWKSPHRGLGLFFYMVAIAIAMFAVSTVIVVQQQPQSWLPGSLTWVRVLMWTWFVIYAARLLRASGEADAPTQPL